ncbi:Actin cross-linking protein [Striga hermonthica]|uniref:Actin cross-linking protein n=1 Tax=Striga hermonthica TaxID=68872 RepID=A0A9N7N076_STRHE|nr:Actin cross-linking protein [Striga hermonthica]
MKVTHDLPHRTATQDWVLWDVDVVDVSVFEYSPSNASSFSSVGDDYSSCRNSPISARSESRATSLASEVLRRSYMVAPERNSHNSGRQVHSVSRSELGMDFFEKARAVRLQSHLGKYLVADEDEVTVRQSRNGASHRAHWAVEFVEGKRERIRLKSCHGLYLTASDEPFLLGMTGKKVLQSLPLPEETDVRVEWEPVREGAAGLKLMTAEGKFLRANGGAPPWRNSVTHDVPHRTATQSWVVWEVDVVDISVSDVDPGSGCFSPVSSFSSYSGTPDIGSPMAMGGYSSMLPNMSTTTQVSGMEFFIKAKSVRLKSHHDKYLTADSDEESVIQNRSGSSISAKWEVEFVSDNVIRLKSRYGKYLKACDNEFLLGVTGRKVTQSLPGNGKLDSSVDWEPLRDGMQVKLKSRYACNFLRANGGLPPWRNSITHDIPHMHHNWVLWEVDVVEVRPESPNTILQSDSLDEDLGSASFHIRIPSVPRRGSFEDSQRKKSEGRLIYYYVAADGEINDVMEERSFQFKGHGLEELTEMLEDETGLEDVIVCSRNIVNGKLYPLRLALPPNNTTMHVVVVPPTSKGMHNKVKPLP